MTTRFISMAFTLSIALVGLSGCATHIGAPQTREDFVSTMRAGGLFKNAETTIIRRPVNAVLADVKDFANQCLNVSVTRPANYAIKEVGGKTTYRTAVHSGQDGVSVLAMQEDYNVKFERGAPPGGIFTFAAEVRAAAGGHTQVDVYYITTKGSIAEALKKWASGDKQGCPSLK